MSDLRLNIHEAKTHLYRYLNELGDEDRIILCRRNQPVAEIRLLRRSSDQSHRLGQAEGEFVVNDQFFEPLPDELLSAFASNS
ncbi:MAG: hypothetical protein U1A77_10600 [Pirellulales bacterium]